MRLQVSAYLVMVSSPISNGHCSPREQYTAMMEQTSYILEPAPGVWEAGPVFFLFVIPFTAWNYLSRLSDTSASWAFSGYWERVKHDLYYWCLGVVREEFWSSPAAQVFLFCTLKDSRVETQLYVPLREALELSPFGFLDFLWTNIPHRSISSQSSSYSMWKYRSAFCVVAYFKTK